MEGLAGWRLDGGLDGGAGVDGVVGEGGLAGWRGCWWMEGVAVAGGLDGGLRRAGLDGGGSGMDGGMGFLNRTEPNRTARRTALNRANRNRVKTHPRNRNEPKRNAALLIFTIKRNYLGAHG